MNLLIASLAGGVAVQIKPTRHVPIWQIGLISLGMTILLAICSPLAVPLAARLIFFGF